jgi:hypothetical protein
VSKWTDLNELYQEQHKKTGVALREFCEENGLNYSTARKYIKASRTAPRKVVKDEGQRLTRAPNFKHGGYSKYFKSGVNELVEATTLEDELDLCRARIHMVMDAIDGIQKLLDDPETDNDARTRLYESLFKAEVSLDKNIGRAESITKTLSSVKTDSLTRGKLIAETARITQQTQALVNATKRGKHQAEIAEHEAAKARKEAGGTSKLDDFIDKRTGGLDTVVSQ